MIQKTSTRPGNSSVAITSRQTGDNDGPHTWGHWAGHKHYSLEVVQNPLRARMCGFGDKDRRPLAPAAVVKMVVRKEDGSLVDVDEIDCSFFLVTVDLWSADGKHEMNLVLHPTSADRYVPSNTPKTKRRGTNSSTQAPPQRTSQRSPTPSSPAPSSPQYSQPSGMTSYISPTTPGYSTQTYQYPSQSQAAPAAEPSNFQQVSPYGQPSDAPPGWGYPPPTSMERASQYAPAAPLPSIHAFGRNGSSSTGPATGVSYNSAAGSGTSPGEGWHLENPGREDSEGMPYRAWPQESSYPPIDSNGPSHSSATIDPSFRPHHPSSSNQEQRESSYAQLPPSSAAEPYSNGRYPPDTFSAMPPQPAQPLDAAVYPPAPYPQQPQQQQYQDASYPQDPTPPSTIPPLPRHTYTRTLVGPLSANACRLLDEHRKPGIFFLFQDLSIRTEGMFRLRLRLMNVGGSPAPEAGATYVHTSVSPVLAQTFTEAFTVYSAKRFPGVPDTTALSIALGSQGQKLPLRNRNGSAKGSKKRPRSGSDNSGDESEEARD